MAINNPLNQYTASGLLKPVNKFNTNVKQTNKTVTGSSVPIDTRIGSIGANGQVTFNNDPLQKMVQPNPPVYYGNSNVQIGGAYTPPIGVKAASQNDNVTPKNNNIQPKDQATIQPIFTPTSTSNAVAGTTESAKINQNQNGQMPVTYPGMLQNLFQQTQNAANEKQKAEQDFQQFQEKYAKEYSGQAGQGIPIEFVQGRQQALQNQYSMQFPYYQAALGAATTSQGQKLGALQGAVGLAAPVQVPYSNQYISPMTGQPVGGDSMTGNAMNDVNTLSQAVINGTMDYGTALSQLGGYGVAIQNQLLPAIQKTNPNFNVAQSQALSQVQGTIGPAMDYARSALDNLLTSVGGLSSVQNTNVPIINQITQGLSTAFGVGSEAVQSYRGALAEARSAIQKVLASLSGGTPTDYVGQSNALLPDNATPNQIAAAKANLEALGQEKMRIYGNPGASSAGGTSGSGSIYDF